MRVCEVIRLLLKYCIYCASAPSLHRESTDSLILKQKPYNFTTNTLKAYLSAQASSAYVELLLRAANVRAASDDTSAELGRAFSDVIEGVRAAAQRDGSYYTKQLTSV